MAGRIADQVGGQHYQTKRPQPITVIEDWGLGYHLGNALKYIARQGDKGGAEDIKKAIWYLERFVQLGSVPEDQK